MPGGMSEGDMGADMPAGTGGAGPTIEEVD